MDSLFPDREWWWSQFLKSDSGDGGGGDADGDGDGDEDGDGDDGGGDDDSAEAKLARAEAALRKERQLHRATKRQLSTVKKTTGIAGAKGGKESSSDDALLAKFEAQQETIEELRRENRMNAAEREFRSVATKAGAPNADRIFKLVKADITFDDDGKPENLADLVADAKREFPELFKKVSGGGDQGGGSSSSKPKKDGGDFFRQLIESNDE